ncbi:MAG: 50S ribosome-binding GTPase [Candidatus Heimdallarchaeota archaeon]|nr:50S ribosome-binding GTPase [Candidatus Heimdallarchaeota archaeon]
MPSIKMYRLKVSKRLHLKEGDDLVSEIDTIITEIQNKKLDKTGDFQILVRDLESYKDETLAKPKSKARQYDPFDILPSGAGRIVLFGMSNVGKSTLMNKITNTEVQVGNYLHTTQIAQAGSCTHKGVNFQIIDLPGFIEYRPVWNINRQINRVARTSDALSLVIDLSLDINKQLEFLNKQLEDAKILTDGVSDIPIFIIATKGDLKGSIKNFELLKQKTNYQIIPISINNEESMEKLKESMFNMLDIVRVYTKPPGRKPDYDAPFVLPRGASVGYLAENIHGNLLKYFKYARIWGESSSHSGQKVGIDHELVDEDVVEIIVEK